MFFFDIIPMALVFGSGLSDFNHIVFNANLNKNLYDPFLWMGINCLEATEFLEPLRF